jgi:hypothetical protein
LLKPLFVSGYIDLEPVEFVPAAAHRGGEMSIFLGKSTAKAGIEESEFLNADFTTFTA